MLNESAKGYRYGLLHAVLWSFAPIVGVLTIQAIPPLVSLTAINAVIFVFFVGVAIYRKSFFSIRFGRGMFYAISASVLIAIVFSLIFTGLKYTTAGNAGIIGQLEFFFSVLFFNMLRREHFSVRELFGGLLMVSGAVLVFVPSVIESASINGGDALILLANMIAPVLNFLQRRAREYLANGVILITRATVGFLTVSLLVFVFGQSATLPEIVSVLPVIVFAGIFVFGLSKVLWLETIRRIPVATANALSSATPVITLVFAYFLLGEIPSTYQILSLVPLLLGAYLLISRERPSSHI